MYDFHSGMMVSSELVPNYAIYSQRETAIASTEDDQVKKMVHTLFYTPFFVNRHVGPSEVFFRTG